MNQGQRNDRIRDLEGRGEETKGIDRKSTQEEETVLSPKAGENKVITVEGMCTRWLKNALKEWEHELEKRPDHEKASVHGKHDTATQKQCRRYMKPLFDKLEQQQVSSNILSKLSTMIGMCDKRRYR